MVESLRRKSGLEVTNDFAVSALEAFQGRDENIPFEERDTFAEAQAMYLVLREISQNISVELRHLQSVRRFTRLRLLRGTQRIRPQPVPEVSIHNRKYYDSNS
jgi:hypothetical protein